jgi:hypothetical protein
MIGSRINILRFQNRPRPLLRDVLHADSLDSTCRKVYRFLAVNLSAEHTSYPQIPPTN